jgi:phosphate acetyltransferase
MRDLTLQVSLSFEGKTMALIDIIYKKAKSVKKTIILPESFEERNLKAAGEIIKEGISNVVLVGNQKEICKKALDVGADISGAIFRDPENDPQIEIFINKLVEIRKHKGVDEAKAKEILNDPIFFAAMLVKCGEADGYVAGAVHATGDVLRPALQIIRTAEGCDTVSSFFIMILPGTSPYKVVREVLFFADCAVVPSPTSNQLSDIAISTSKSFKSLIENEEPRVAMLSFSTHGSAKHDDALKIIEATQMLKEKDSSILADGELQADSALIEKVAKQKCPESIIGGKANILVFPDLNSGNISYKLVQRLAGASAIGPIVQGLSKPVNDLSRGCSVKDIVDTVAVTACQVAN